jgi:hypothetical protein
MTLTRTMPGWFAAAIAACDPVAWGDPEPLVAHDGWRPLEGEDPFGAPPEGAWCDGLGWGPEDFGGEPSFDVRTGICPWLTVQQAMSAELEPTDRLFIRVWHDMLVSPDPDPSARIGVSVVDDLVFEQVVPIPTQSGIILADLELRRGIETGTLLRFHVDNHGANSYHLLEISRRPAVPPKDAVDLGVPP